MLRKTPFKIPQAAFVVRASMRPQRNAAENKRERGALRADEMLQ